jgi:hypothetical protein
MEKVQGFEKELKIAHFECKYAKEKLETLKEELSKKRAEVAAFKHPPKLPKIPSQFLASYKLAKNKDKYSPKKNKLTTHNPKSKSFSLLKT